MKKIIYVAASLLFLIGLPIDASATESSLKSIQSGEATEEKQEMHSTNGKINEIDAFKEVISNYSTDEVDGQIYEYSQKEELTATEDAKATALQEEKEVRDEMEASIALIIILGMGCLAMIGLLYLLISSPSSLF